MNSTPRLFRHRTYRLLLTLILLAAAQIPRDAPAWGQPHQAITKAALEVLPAWQKEILGSELAALHRQYCLIPDQVFTDKDNAKFATMDRHPGEVYLKKLHLPVPEQPENLETLRYFIGKSVAALQAGNTADAARFMGTICHVIEDFGSPSHTLPGDNMFTLLQQFLPPTDIMKDKLMHGPIENGTFEVNLNTYQPRLLGTSVDEAAWRLLHRIHAGIIHARGTTIPIIQALYAGDEPTVVRHQMRAAVMDGQIVADALHTLLCLGSVKFDEQAQQSLRKVGMAAYWPMEAVNLYYPQTHFFSAPHWGHARVGVVLADGTRAVPIKLRLTKGNEIVEQEFTHGISSGVGRPLTWHLPKGVYHRFTVLAGLQAGLGTKGRVEFTVRGDGKSLATAIVAGTEPAHRFDCDIAGVSLLQLAADSRGLDPKSNHAVWAEPILVKEPPN